MTENCSAPSFTSVPANNQLEGSYCGDLTFDFIVDPGMDGSSPATIVDLQVVAGIGSIDQSGIYSAGFHDPGTYPVSIEITNSCGWSAEYNFDVILTNDEPSLARCQYNCGLLSQGWSDS